MTTRKETEKKRDMDFDMIAEAVRVLRPPHTPNTVDVVMRQIATMPLPDANSGKTRRISIRTISTVAAACFLAAVGTTLYMTHGNIQAANNAPLQDINSRIYDIYNYCNDYASEEAVENSAYYDDPIIDLL